MKAAPTAISSIASVVMNGGRFSLTTGSALTQPAAQPTPTATSNVAAISGKPLKCNGIGEKRGDDAGERNERSDREVDARRDDDERLTDAENAVVGDLAQDAHDVARLEERTARRDVDDRNQRDEEGRGADDSQPVGAAVSLPSRRRARCDGDDSVRRRVRARELGRNPSVAHHEDAVRHAEHFGKIARNHHDRRAARGQLEHELVDLRFRADVDAARRLVEKKDARVPEQPFCEHDLLLRSARKVAHELFGAWRFDLQLVDHARRRGPLASEVDEQVAIDEIRQVRKRNVFAHRHPEHQALRLAIFGDERDAGAQSPRRCAPAAPALPSTRTSPRSAASAPAIARKISVLPGADQPGQADDLAGAHRKAHAVDDGSRRSDPRTSRRIGASGGGIGKLGKVRVEPPSDHRADDLVGWKISRVSRVSTILPSRNTVTRSAMRESSSIRCEM